LLVSPSLAISQETLTPEQIVNSLKAKAAPSAASVPADEILNRIKNLVVVKSGEETRPAYVVAQPNGIPSPDEVKEIAPIVAGLPSVSIEVYFDFNSADIRQESMPSLLALGKALTDPAFRDSRFIVGGHTDGVGSVDYNLRLSQARAEAVRHFLVQRFPITPEALTSLGFGKTMLRDSANPDAAINRRVQVINLGRSG
jgi:outer membrane protein OmpA-like peptidoglycan-associated protein